MTANPVHVGNIVDHGPHWTWFALDRVPDLRPGDVIRVRSGCGGYPLRTGECRVLDVLGTCVHVERPVWSDIAAIADDDHVYLTERRCPYVPGEKMTDQHPDSVIAQIVEETIAKRVEYLVTPVHEPERLLALAQKSAPASPGKQWVTALSRAMVVEDLAQQGHITREQALELMQAPQMTEPEPVARRSDGFDQRQVDACRAALLSPAPPRYPRAR